MHSASLCRPGLDLPPVKTQGDEDRELAPYPSGDLASEPSTTRQSRQNIKREQGLGASRVLPRRAELSGRGSPLAAQAGRPLGTQGTTGEDGPRSV